MSALATHYQLLRRLLLVAGLGMVFILLTLYAILRLGEAAAGRGESHHYLMLLGMAGVGLLALLGLIFWQLFALLQHLRRHRLGARLTASFALSMLTAATLPVLVIAYFSWQFISYNLGQSFNTRVSATLEDALQLTREAITMRARQALDESKTLANELSEMSYPQLVRNLEPLRQASGALMLAIFNRQGNIVAFAHRNLEVMSVAQPSAEALIRANQEQQYFAFSSFDDEYSINVLSVFHHQGSTYYLKSVYAMPESFNSLASSVRENYRHHETYKYLQPHITTSILLVLGLVLAFTLLFICWLSVLFGEHMTLPLRTLMRATRRIADGDYHSQVKGLPHNDLGILGEHFNRMSAALNQAREQHEAARQQLAQQKEYLETLMDNISAGVLVVDDAGEIHTSNANAEKILETALPPGEPPHCCEELLQATASLRASARRNWQEQVVLHHAESRKVLMCHGAKWQSGTAELSILVFDDITDFIHNQRNAAWEEVARRLAHEIKNPLTPIRLQSERLQRKIKDKLSHPEDQNIVQRATDTIIQQVDAMQAMVSDFSRFAKPLELRRTPIALSTLLEEVRNLYPENTITLEVPDAAVISGDAVQLRQVFINLFKNALEASPEPQILCSVQQLEEGIGLSVEDNGPGFANLTCDPFEPYVTTKARGTGLGLAIVKKIIQEHAGSITIGNSSRLGGAKITILFPKTP